VSLLNMPLWQGDYYGGSQISQFNVEIFVRTTSKSSFTNTARANPSLLRVVECVCSTKDRRGAQSQECLQAIKHRCFRRRGGIGGADRPPSARPRRDRVLALPPHAAPASYGPNSCADALDGNRSNKRTIAGTDVAHSRQ